MFWNQLALGKGLKVFLERYTSVSFVFLKSGLAVFSRDFAPAIVESLVLSALVVSINSTATLHSKNYGQNGEKEK